jgi:hypothetical protein
MARVDHASDDRIPEISATLAPPSIYGPAMLATAIFAGQTPQSLLPLLQPASASAADMQAAALDTSFLCQLAAGRQKALDLQAEVLAHACLFRVAGPAAPTLRVLALLAPGDLQVNTPIEFLTAHLPVRLDFLYLGPGLKLPAEIPDHDVAFCAVSDAAADTLRRVMALRPRWPRPMINDPARIIGLTRTGAAHLLRDLPGLLVPETAAHTRATLHAAGGLEGLVPGAAGPLLIRPAGSHAGAGLERVTDVAALADYLARHDGPDFQLARFVDYRSPDRLYRKSRVVLIDGAPFLAHMAASSHWMVHYLNGGMEHDAAKRADEAEAMAAFDTGFARRHAPTLAALHARLGLDYVMLDCAEAPDGRLLLFEVEVAGIVHMMDPPDLFPYKPPQMRRVFAAFERLLRSRAESWRTAIAAPALPQAAGCASLPGCSRLRCTAQGQVEPGAAPCTTPHPIMSPRTGS